MLTVQSCIKSDLNQRQIHPTIVRIYMYEFISKYGQIGFVIEEISEFGPTIQIVNSRCFDTFLTLTLESTLIESYSPNKLLNLSESIRYPFY